MPKRFRSLILLSLSACAILGICAFVLYQVRYQQRLDASNRQTLAALSVEQQSAVMKKITYYEGRTRVKVTATEKFQISGKNYTAIQLECRLIYGLLDASRPHRSTTCRCYVLASESGDVIVHDEGNTMTGVTDFGKLLSDCGTTADAATQKELLQIVCFIFPAREGQFVQARNWKAGELLYELQQKDYVIWITLRLKENRVHSASYKFERVR